MVRDDKSVLLVLSHTKTLHLDIRSEAFMATTMSTAVGTFDLRPWPMKISFLNISPVVLVGIKGQEERTTDCLIPEQLSITVHGSTTCSLCVP